MTGWPTFITRWLDQHQPDDGPSERVGPLADTMTALERFIYRHEPLSGTAGSARAAQFRQDLANALHEVKRLAADEAVMLYRMGRSDEH